MGTVNVPGLQGKVVYIALEEVRPSLETDSFAATVQEANDLLDDTISDALDALEWNTTEAQAGDSGQVSFGSDLTDSDTSGESVYASTGDRIEVYCPLDEACYAGKVSDADANDSRVEIQYDDGDNENLHLRHETWRFVSSSTVLALTANLSVLGSTEQQDLGTYLETFCNKQFIRHPAQDLPLHALHTAYLSEEDSFKRNVSVVALLIFPQKANLICSPCHL